MFYCLIDSLEIEFCVVSVSLERNRLDTHTNGVGLEFLLLVFTAVTLATPTDYSSQG